MSSTASQSQRLDTAELETARRRIVRLDEYRRHLRGLAAELTLAEERERRRIAQGLHDEIGQVLGVVKLKLSELAGDELWREERGGAARVQLEEIRGHVDDMLREIRSLTFELSSPALHELGLEAALQALADHFAVRHGLACRVVADRVPRRLTRDTEIALYSILRELLWNVVKHARAHTVEMSLSSADGWLRIAVTDDGEP